MDKLNRRSMSGPIALAAALALGVAAAWGYAASWGEAALKNVFRSMSESLEITRDGRALVRHIQRQGGTWVVSYRTPDGQDVTEPLALTAPYVELAPPPTKPQMLGWTWRVLGYSDTRTVAAEWYLIREGTSPGRAYFAIYDSQTKTLVGYFGPQGFRLDAPPAAEQFSDVPRNGCEALPIAFDDYGWSQWWRVSALYLIAEGKLWSIDLERRSLRTIAIPGEPVSIALATEVPQSGDAIRINYQVVVRTDEDIVFLGKNGAPERTLSIPAEIRQRLFNVCTTVSGQVVLTAPQPHDVVEVFWLGDAGGAERHESVQLASLPSSAQDATSWYNTIVLPAPALQVVAYPFYAHILAESASDGDMRATLGKLLFRDWPAILAVCALSAALAVLCYRHHARYADRGGAAWALFVLVTGVPGAIGYWLHRRWPTTERCAHCGATTPRDRDACLACASEFAAPAATGIEVFA
jgi:hypothetical protein